MQEKSFRCPPSIWSGDIPEVTASFLQQLRDREFKMGIAINPATGEHYTPSCAQGAGLHILSEGCSESAVLWQWFNTHVLPPIMQHDPRPLKPAQHFMLLRMTQGDEFPWHDDVGGQNGVLETPAYSCLMYVDSTQGGTLECIDPQTKKRRVFHSQPGRFVAFSATVRHRVTPLKSACRHAVLLRVFV